MFERSEFAALPMLAPQRREPRRGDVVAVAFLCLLSLGETKESERLPGRPRLGRPKKTKSQLRTEVPGKVVRREQDSTTHRGTRLASPKKTQHQHPRIEKQQLPFEGEHSKEVQHRQPCFITNQSLSPTGVDDKLLRSTHGTIIGRQKQHHARQM